MSDLRTKRTMARITLAEIAEKAGVSITYLSAIERGLQPSDRKVPARVSKVLDGLVKKRLEETTKAAGLEVSA